MTRTCKRIVASWLASCAFVGAPAAAQENTTEDNKPATEEPAQPGAPAAQSVADDAQTGLNEIVVTAQRTRSDAQRTPVALTVYTGEDLSAAGVTNVLTLQSVDPSINASTSNGTSYIAIRGIASTDTTETGDPSVSISRDGFFTNRSYSIATSMYDLERVEVLKGPQGTLFGRNATGGLIQLITRRPGKTFGANGSVEFGNYDLFNVEAGVDMPLGDAAQLRFAGIRRYHKGYRKLEVIGGRGDDDDTWSGRATLAVQPFDGFDGLIQYQHDDIDNVGDVQHKTQFGERPEGSSKSFPNWEDTFNRLKGDRIRWEFSYDKLPGDLTLFYAGGFDRQRWQHALDGTSLDADGGPVFFANFQQAESPDTWNHEVRIATPQDGKLSAQAGYFMFREDNKLDSGLINRDLHPGEYGIRFRYKLKTKSDGVFGQVGFRPANDVKITGGARYSWDSKKRTGFSELNINAVANLPPFIPPIPIIRVDAPEGGERYKSSKPTFHVGVDWTPTGRNMVYAKFDTGFKAGGFNSNGREAAVQYGPETIQAWELGTKNRFLSNQLQLNADVFYQNYKGYQASQSTDALGDGSGVFNAGDVLIYGAEVQFVAALGATRFDANTTLLRTKFKNVDEPILRGDGVPANAVDINGNDLPNAPRFVITAGLEHAFELGTVTVTPRIDGKHSSSYNFSIFNDPDTEQHAYTTGNLSLNVVSENFPVQALLFVRNFTDKKIFASAGRFYVTDPDINTYQYQPPRTYGIRLSAKFRS